MLTPQNKSPELGEKMPQELVEKLHQLRTAVGHDAVKFRDLRDQYKGRAIKARKKKMFGGKKEYKKNIAETKRTMEWYAQWHIENEKVLDQIKQRGVASTANDVPLFLANLGETPVEFQKIYAEWVEDWKKWHSDPIRRKNEPSPEIPKYNPYIGKTRAEASIIMNEFLESKYQLLEQSIISTNKDKNQNVINTEEKFDALLQEINDEFNKLMGALPHLHKKDLTASEKEKSKATNQWFDTKVKMYMLNIENYEKYSHLWDLKYKEEHPKQFKELSKNIAKPYQYTKDYKEHPEKEPNIIINTMLNNDKIAGLGIVYIDSNDGVNRWGHVALAFLDKDGRPLGYTHVDELAQNPKFMTPEQFKDYMDNDNRNMMAIQKITKDDGSEIDLKQAISFMKEEGGHTFYWNPITHNCTDWVRSIIEAGKGSVEYNERREEKGGFLPVWQLARVNPATYAEGYSNKPNKEEFIGPAINPEDILILDKPKTKKEQEVSEEFEKTIYHTKSETIFKTTFDQLTKPQEKEIEKTTQAGLDLAEKKAQTINNETTKQNEEVINAAQSQFKNTGQPTLKEKSIDDMMEQQSTMQTRTRSDATLEAAPPKLDKEPTQPNVTPANEDMKSRQRSDAVVGTSRERSGAFLHKPKEITPLKPKKDIIDDVKLGKKHSWRKMLGKFKKALSPKNIKDKITHLPHNIKDKITDIKLKSQANKEIQLPKDLAPKDLEKNKSLVQESQQVENNQELPKRKSTIKT